MLNPTETELVGQWAAHGARVVGDDVCRRIDELTGSKLQKLADGNWTSLYRDPDDGRLWEKTYPQGHFQGGGPPALKCISSQEAYARYGNVPNSLLDIDASRRST
jgi:hypothetical protein